jgi:DNA polymerase-1
MKVKEKKILLVDGYSIISRAFYGIRILTDKEGRPTNALYGFFTILFKVIEEEKPDYIAVCFDVDKNTFRHQMYKEYKGTRKETPAELKQQVPFVLEMLDSMNIKHYEVQGFEADDLIGTISVLSEKEGASVVILSGDKDMLQLATDKIKVRIPKTTKGVTEVFTYFEKDVLSELGVTPTQFIDVKALMGDTSDNIKGVPKIGKDTAPKLIAEFGSLDGIYENIDKIDKKAVKQSLIDNKEEAYFCKTLVTIRKDVPIDFKLEDNKADSIFNTNSFEVCKKYELKKFYSKFTEKNDAKTFDAGEQNLNFDAKVINDKFMLSNIIDDTNSLDIIGISIIENGEKYYLALALDDKRNYVIEEVLDEKPLSIDNIREITSQILEKSKTKIALLDLKENLFFIEERYRDSNRLVDISLMSYINDPINKNYGAFALLSNNFGIVIDEKSLSKKDLAIYNAVSALSSYGTEFEKLKQSGQLKLYEDLERPLINVLYDIEKEGILVDKKLLKDYGKELESHIKVLEKEVYKLAGCEFNINSPKQLGEVLFEKLKLKGAKKTKTGYSTNAEVLEKLKDEHPVVDKVLEYRTYTKLNSTYAVGLLTCIADDGRIHTKLNQMGTATGRLASEEPNLQNIPIRTELGRKFRDVFIPKKDFVFIDSDYSQIELRILASMSGDENLIHSYEASDDVHAITASKVFNIPLEKVTPDLRRRAKAVNFGVVYGISAYGLSEDLTITPREAREYIEQYFDTYPKVKEFLDNQVSLAKEQGYVTTILGRHRPVPELKSNNYMVRSFGERIAMNSPIQGSGADIIKLAMLAIYKKFKEEKLESKIVLQVHDEILIEASKRELDKVKQIVKSEMENAMKLKVKLVISMNEGDNWNNAH